ncbi:glutathione S-transferase 1-like [Phthorimaea operculella]|nr:glutathione S-transferase 1-like [Phthorimaea operculella]
MAPITLYHLYGSPPSCAVRMMAEILGVPLELKIIDFANLEHKSPEYRKMNPMGTVPVLKDGDLYVSESHTIIKYLLDKFGKEEHKKLYPTDRVQRAAVDLINFYDTGVAFIRVKLIALPAFFHGQIGIPEKVAKEVEEVYETVEMYLVGKNYIASNEFTVADLSMGSTINTLNSFQPVDKTKYPLTVAWLDRLRAKPFFQKIAVHTAETLYNAVTGMWARSKASQ